MFKNWLRSPAWGDVPLNGAQVLVGAAIMILIAGAAFVSLQDHHDNKSLEISSQSRSAHRYVPSDAQWATLPG